MDYLIDTNNVTALANGNANALNHLQNLTPADEVFSCFVIVGE